MAAVAMGLGGAFYYIRRMYREIPRYDWRSACADYLVAVFSAALFFYAARLTWQESDWVSLAAGIGGAMGTTGPKWVGEQARKKLSRLLGAADE